MCNIAGYAGKRRAAPILIDMLRRQECFDGGLATGIATVHEGKLYMRKIPKNLDALIKETDALDLPGNIGIIHTRPGNNPPSFTHPHLSEDGQMAVVLNGTISFDKYSDHRDKTAQLANNAGYEYVAKCYDGCKTFPTLADGAHVPEGEQIAHLVAMYKRQGYDYSEALKLACEGGFTEMVSVMLTANDPERIRVGRISRPMHALVGDGECFIATCEYAFPNDVGGVRFPLPTLNVCEICASGVTVTGNRINVEPVADITPRSYFLGMELIEGFLKEKAEVGGAYFDQLELFLKDHQHELFDGGYIYAQYARLVYELIYRLDTEGRLKSELRPSPKGNRILRYMWL